MKVMIISSNWGHGGPGAIASDLYSVLCNHGVECCFAYGRGSIPSTINSFRFGSEIECYLHALKSRILDKAGFGSKHATRQLIRKIKEYNPDVISIHNPLGYVLDVEMLFEYIRNSQVRTYWTMHDCWALTGHCITGFCQRYGTCGKCPKKREFPASYIIDNSRRNLERKKRIFTNINNLQIITPSNWLAQLIKSSYLREYSPSVIYNGIDLSVFKPRKSNLREIYGWNNKIILLFVAGVWEKFKGAKYVYELASVLEDDFVMVMIGKNNDQELKNISRIVHIERTDNRDCLAEWYSVADLFVNPTIGDNFPTVNLESLACGTPVITFDTGGSGESVGHCGEIVPQGSVEKLVDAIKKTIMRNISSQECVKRACQYDRNTVYEQYLKLFEGND